MLLDFSDFLRSQAAALDAVQTTADLSAWHQDFARKWTADAKSRADAANATLRLTGDQIIRDELGYLVAERERVPGQRRRHRWILVSANPGWNAVTNPTERSLKGQGRGDGPGDVEAYEGYRTRFFPRWYDHVIKPKGPSRAMWWNRALSFMHRVVGLEKPAQMAAIHDDLDILGWELWPFHSTKDGLSFAAKTNVDLDAFANASIRAACRHESDGVVIASKAGAERVLRLVGTEFTQVEAMALVNGTRVERLRHVATGRLVVVVARQLFAGWALPRPELQAIAAFAGGATPLAAVRPVSMPQIPIVVPVEGPIVVPVEGPINVKADDGVGPLLMAVHVCGHEGAESTLDALGDDADEEEVHVRVGGYWVTARDGGRAAEVGAARSQGRQVLIVGVHKGLIVRALELVTAEDYAMPPEFRHSDGRQFRRFAHQPAWTLEGTRGPLRFATAYLDVAATKRSEVRVRYHTRSFDDSAWVGRRLVTPSAQIPQTPPLYGLDGNV